MTTMQRTRGWMLALVLAAAGGGVGSASAAPALALGDAPKYPPDFAHFDYVNPDAPKGGELTLSAQGSFDSLNPFLLKGIGAAGLGELVFETLTTQSWDEPFTAYGLLAEDIELAADGLSVTFRLRPEARFSDGSPVTAEDVRHAFETLISDAAHPQYRVYWADVRTAEVLDARTVRFHFAKRNPELHLIIGQMPVFARAWIGERRFDEVVQDAPLGSGPYVVERHENGKFIRYRRNPEYWGQHLGGRRGMYNFDRVTFKYYRDTTVALEAFKAGEFDYVTVFNSKEWARDYTGPRFASGEIQRQELAHSNNAGIQGFVFNLRRPLFSDRRVRRAIGLAFDFEWSNENLFYGQYTRNDSYFSNSELAARGLPEGDELALLEPFREQLPAEVFTEVWTPPTTAAPSSIRHNLRRAKALLEDAGWRLEDGVMVRDGQRLEFEVMLVSKAFERIMAPFAANLARLGVQVSYRTVDPSLYQRSADTFDFDMMVNVFGQSQSPGNEQIGYWHSSVADQEGSNNLIGLRDPVVDALVERLVYAEDRQSLVTAARALDRVLLHGEYLVPNFYSPVHRIAYWNRFAYPDTLPLYYQATAWFLATAWAR